MFKRYIQKQVRLVLEAVESEKIEAERVKSQKAKDYCDKDEKEKAERAKLAHRQEICLHPEWVVESRRTGMQTAAEYEVCILCGLAKPTGKHSGG